MIKNIIMKNCEVIDFKFADIADKTDLLYAGAWSRVYEYEYITNFIKQHNSTNCKIHNTAWGSSGVHILFKDTLDALGECVHSDIFKPVLKNTIYYDILTENKEFENLFDFVLNVSTIEHLTKSTDRILAIKNLFAQVKVGGYLILTFDYPRVQLSEIEKLVSLKCKTTQTKVTGENSISPNIIYKHLNVIYLILRKI